MLHRFLTGFAVVASLLVAGCAAPPLAHVPATLRVNVFPGSSNLPLLAAINKGYFAKRDLTIEVQNTPDSDSQRAGLPAGRFDIAIAAVDNAVAMVELAKNDVIIVTGGDSGMNEFMVRPDINSFADIRGKLLAVDAPNTAYALVGKKIQGFAGGPRLQSQTGGRHTGTIRCDDRQPRAVRQHGESAVFFHRT